MNKAKIISTTNEKLLCSFHDLQDAKNFQRFLKKIGMHDPSSTLVSKHKKIIPYINEDPDANEEDSYALELTLEEYETIKATDIEENKTYEADEEGPYHNLSFLDDLKSSLSEKETQEVKVEHEVDSIKPNL